MTRKILKQRLLHYGGYGRARRIYARIQYHSLARRYSKFLRTGSAPLPDKVMFEPTQRCNLRCKMCFQNRSALASPHELTLSQITDFFDRNVYLKKVTLIGGEVFLRSDAMDLIGHLNDSRNIVICTNGTLIGDAEVNELTRFQRLYTMCISLDGPKDIHESIRSIKGSYDQVIRTIKALAPLLPVTVNLVIQDENLPFIPDTVDLCASLHVKKVKIELERIYSTEKHAQEIAEIGLIPSDIPLASKGRARGYSPETLRDVLRECQDRGRRSPLDVFIDPPYLMDEIKACHSGNLLTTKRFICHTIDTATIAPNGDVIHCIHIRKPFGNILGTPFDEIWNSAVANDFRRRLLTSNLTPLCENCPFMRPAPHRIVSAIPSPNHR
jgi:radical SAM protein with 4Fe4S-binding SPASM domain